MSDTRAPEPAVIDELAAAAVQGGDEPGSPESTVRWGALWRVVLPLERWYFVRDDAEALRPGLVSFNGRSAVPVFTDIKRAIAFADAGRGGANKVFASPPAQMLTAVDQMSEAGIELLVFNVEDAPFAAPPAIVGALAKDLDRLEVQNAAQRANPHLDPAEKTTIDHLAANARANPTENAAQAAMWQEVFSLETWFFVPRGEGASLSPYAVTMEQGPAILVFTTPARAAHFATERQLENADQVLGIPVTSAVDALSGFAATGVALVHFDPQNGGFTARLEDLRAMQDHLAGRGGSGA